MWRAVHARLNQFNTAQWYCNHKVLCLATLAVQTRPAVWVGNQQQLGVSPSPAVVRLECAVLHSAFWLAGPSDNQELTWPPCFTN